MKPFTARKTTQQSEMNVSKSKPGRDEILFGLIMPGARGELVNVTATRHRASNVSLVHCRVQRCLNLSPHTSVAPECGIRLETTHPLVCVIKAAFCDSSLPLTSISTSLGFSRPRPDLPKRCLRHKTVAHTPALLLQSFPRTGSAFLALDHPRSRDGSPIECLLLSAELRNRIGQRRRGYFLTYGGRHFSPVDCSHVFKPYVGPHTDSAYWGIRSQ